MVSPILVWSPAARGKSHTFAISLFPLFSGNSVYIPDDVRFIRWAPNFGAAGLAPRPRPADKGLTLVVGAGAAIAAQGSSSSVTFGFKFKGFDVFGAGAAMEPHKSSSSSLFNFGVLMDRKFEAEEIQIKKTLPINTRVNKSKQMSKWIEKLGLGIFLLLPGILSNFQVQITRYIKWQ